MYGTAVDRQRASTSLRAAEAVEVDPRSRPRPDDARPVLVLAQPPVLPGPASRPRRRTSS